MTDSAQARDRLIQVLRLDLIGPTEGDSLANEVLDQAPSRWYLTGFLVPYAAPDEQRTDPAADDEIDSVEGDGAGDDESTPERIQPRKLHFPSSLGTSVLVPAKAKHLDVTALWGDYKLLPSKKEEGNEHAGKGACSDEHWQRTQRSVSMRLTLPDRDHEKCEVAVPESDGLDIVIVAKPATLAGFEDSDPPLPKGTRAVSVFLVNRRDAQPDAIRDQAFAFQAGLQLRLDTGFVARPDPRGRDAKDEDDLVADLQYRDVFEYAVGHNVATRAEIVGDKCMLVETSWIPTHEVEKVEQRGLKEADLGMESLAAAATGGEVQAKLEPIISAYAEWIEKQRGISVASKARKNTAAELFKGAERARDRIRDGLAALDDPQILEAFRLANQAMARAARQRMPEIYKDGRSPSWRLFQIAFLVMNLRAIAEPEHSDRATVELIFFPTGGGKTEAYLGLAAFTLILRRLKNPGLRSAGVSVLMRYTLRLLTLDQLGRAATLICALELERQNDIEKLGTWPFEIGLWVGRAATPNRMGGRGDADPETARNKTNAYKRDTNNPLPIPLENCPWCGTRFTKESFRLEPNPDEPKDLNVVCANRRCEFHGNDHVPIVAVDEPIYRRLPCFLIATVDKFAALPWTGRTGALFGKVQRYDRGGFYGPCDPAVGQSLGWELLPPDLIIQDELHLISGPLGTMTGLYETAIEALSRREGSNRPILPKVIASTATVRRARAQIRGIFGRSQVDVFPPPGLDRSDNFFSYTMPAQSLRGRLYVGLSAPGRSAKVLLLRTYLALLAGAQRLYHESGGTAKANNPADPYMTLVGYFGSLRELGGSRRIVEDEVANRVARYELRKRVGEVNGPFASREINRDVSELTSRETTSRIAATKRRLALPHPDKERIDVAVATNMISVGLDIPRLGLMVVTGVNAGKYPR